MSLFFLINPKSYDASDAFDVYVAKKRKHDRLEEEIAAQLLQAQQSDFEIPKKINTTRLVDILQSKLHATPKPGEVVDKQRTHRINILLLLLTMDD